jgi:hypothetical protein
VPDQNLARGGDWPEEIATAEGFDGGRILVMHETLRQRFCLQQAQGRGSVGKGLPLVIILGVG